MSPKQYQPIPSYAIVVAATAGLFLSPATAPYFHFLSCILVIAHSSIGYTILTRERNTALAQYSPLIIFFVNVLLIALAGFSSRTANYEMGFMVVAVSLAVSLIAAVVILFVQMARVAKMAAVQSGVVAHDTVSEEGGVVPALHWGTACRDAGLWPVLMYLALFYVSMKYGEDISRVHYGLVLVVVPQVTAGVLSWILVRIKRYTPPASFRVATVFALIMACVTTALTVATHEQEGYTLVAYVFSTTVSVLGSVFYAALGILVGRVGLSVAKKQG